MLDQRRPVYQVRAPGSRGSPERTGRGSCLWEEVLELSDELGGAGERMEVVSAGVELELDGLVFGLEGAAADAADGHGQS